MLGKQVKKEAEKAKTSRYNSIYYSFIFFLAIPDTCSHQIKMHSCKTGLQEQVTAYVNSVLQLLQCNILKLLLLHDSPLFMSYWKVCPGCLAGGKEKGVAHIPQYLHFPMERKLCLVTWDNQCSHTSKCSKQLPNQRLLMSLTFLFVAVVVVGLWVLYGFYILQCFYVCVFCVYRSRTWKLANNAPMHNEMGFMQIKPGSSTVAFIIAQNNGMSTLHSIQLNQLTYTNVM